MKFFSQISLILFTILLVFTGLRGELFSQNTTTYIPEEVSRLWIEGRSNINEFECEANRYFGEAVLVQSEDPIEFIQEANERVYLQVEIDVDGFECGRSRMNRDLQEALKSSEFPEIIFLFDSAEFIGFVDDENENENDIFEVEVRGTLTVAGKTRDIHFVTRAYYLEPQRIRAIGKTSIKMSDFDVEPPTALMGLIKADDELTVNFDLVASETEQLCQLCPHLQSQ